MLWNFLPNDNMKQYDFGKIVDRHGTNCIKYDTLAANYGRSDLIPLWVADMDFETPDFIIDAMKRRLEHPIFGYTAEYDGYWDSITSWLREQHDWHVEREWLRYIPGIVKGIGMVINVFTEPGDKIIIQPPIYHPFRLIPLANGREVAYNPLKSADGEHYEMDFDNLENIIDERCKVLLLSSPHNPIGIMWDRDTLARLAEIAAAHDILVVSDEIHCDMPLYGHTHIPFAAVSDAAAHCSITFGAPSKTFNLAGIVSSYSIVPDRALRDKFYSWLAANEFDMATIFAMTATEAAFTLGDGWRRQMLRYVEGNIDFVADYLERNIPQVRAVKPQASYLVWLDFSRLGLKHETLVDLIVNKARLAMNDGAMFGAEGRQHMRMNVGCPRSVLAEALSRLEQAVNGLGR